MNSVILCMQNTQDGHSKERDTDGRDVDGRAHRVYIKGFKSTKKYLNEARGGEEKLEIKTSTAKSPQDRHINKNFKTPIMHMIGGKTTPK